MKELQPNACYRIRFSDGATVDFQTMAELHDDLAHVRVRLRSKRMINLHDLLKDRWDAIIQVECIEDLTAEAPTKSIL